MGICRADAKSSGPGEKHQRSAAINPNTILMAAADAAMAAWDQLTAAQ
jgi:hypothetical protein